MISTERLYLTLDGRRVVDHGNRDAAFLLVSVGAEIPKGYTALVEAFYAAKVARARAESRPAPLPDIAENVPAAPPLSADDIEGYETRIPTNIRRRGRPRKIQAGFVPGD